MIGVSSKRKDSVFVVRTLRTYKLSPVPLPGYYDAPDYRWSGDGWERVVEWYPWGAVVYAERPGDAVTIVLQGDVDLAAGIVKTNGEPERIPVEWYAELARRCEMPKQPTVPECAGYWIAGPTCDGGNNPQTGEHENACSWRRRCRMIQQHLVGLDTDPQSYRKRYGPEALARLVERLEKSDGKAPPTKKRKRPAKRTPKQSPERRRAKRYAPLKKMAEAFAAELASATVGTRIIWCERRTAAVRPGCVYFLDRTDRSAYLSLYMRRRKGRPLKLAVVRLAPVNGGLDIQLPDESAPAKLPKDLRWSTWRDQPMNSVVRTLKTSKHYKWMAARLVKAATTVLEDA